MPVNFTSNPPPQGGGEAQPSVWGNLRSVLAQPSFGEQQLLPPQQHTEQPPSAPSKRAIGFLRPFSAKPKGDEVLRLGPAPEGETAQPPAAKDWKTFVAGWLADEEEVPAAVDGPSGRVTLGVNSALAEMAGDAAPAATQAREGNAPAQTPLKPAIRPKTAIRGVSAAPKARAKSAFRRPGAPPSAQPSQQAQAQSGKDNGATTADEDGDDENLEKGILKRKKKKKERDKKNPFIMPTLHMFSFENLVHNIVWRVGRNFGFQAFNINPRTKNKGNNAEWTPATIFVATDHLVQVLIKNYFMRREKGPNERQEERFAKAVFEMHTMLFYAYEEYWTHMHGLSIRPQAMQDVLNTKPFCDEAVVCGMLSELALFYLVYSEASSIRHTPEVMWFIYWCLNHSYVMMDLWHRPPPENFPSIREVRIGLRNKYQGLISEVKSSLAIYPDRYRPEDCGRLAPIMARLKGTDIPENQRILVADLIAFGDGNFYYERIVQPIFNVFSYEIDHLSNMGIDVAHRLGYDDINESMAHTGVVRLCLRDLRVRTEQIVNGEANDAYTNITQLGFPRGRPNTNFDPQVAADWWRSNVFVKTFRERRTWLSMFRAFFRVFTAHFVLFHGMQAQTFVGWDWRIISSCLITHAFCHALERFANWYVTRNPPEPHHTNMVKTFDRKGRFKISKRANAQAMHEGMAAGFGDSKAIGSEKTRMQPVRVIELEGAPYLGILGFVEWVFVAFIVLGWYVLQWYEGPFQKFCWDYWPRFSAAYVAAFALHWVLTTRDGYVISLTHALNLPQIFKASSSRPDPMNWLCGKWNVKWKMFFSNALFWSTAIIMKVLFDYYLICKPSVKPLKQTFRVNWLECAKSSPKYFDFFPCIGADWVLAFVRVAPFVVVILLDTSLFFSVATAQYGVIRGLFKLDLGVLTTWDEVVKEFYKAPYRWWFKCMSESGNRNQLSLLKMMLFDNATDKETGALVSDGKMFKKAVLTPEEIMGKKRSVNVAAILDDEDEGDGNAGAGGHRVSNNGATKGAKGGEQAKPLSTGWKTALQNFGMRSDQPQAPQKPQKIAPTKGGPLLPTSKNTKAMEKQLHQLQRVPPKLPMTTITERMIAATERPKEAGDANRPKLASVAEKLLGNKHAAATASLFKEMTPDQKRSEILTRIQDAKKLRREAGGDNTEGPVAAGLPHVDNHANVGAGGGAALLVNAAPTPAQSRWSRALGALKARTSASGAEANDNTDVRSPDARRNTLTGGAPPEEVVPAKPDEEALLRPFSAASAATLNGESRKALRPRRGESDMEEAGGVKANAALPMPLEELEGEADRDKPASHGSASTHDTLERAGFLTQAPRVATPPLIGGGLLGSVAGMSTGSDGGQRAREQLRSEWETHKARMATDPMQRGSPTATMNNRITSDSSGAGAAATHPAWPSLLPAGSIMQRQGNGRMSANGGTGQSLAGSPMDAPPPPRYSWTGAANEGATMGRMMSSTRQPADATLGSSAQRTSRYGGPNNDANNADLMDMGEYLSPAARAALAGRQEEDADDLAGGYKGYNRMFSDAPAGAEHGMLVPGATMARSPRDASGGSSAGGPAMAGEGAGVLRVESLTPADEPMQAYQGGGAGSPSAPQFPKPGSGGSRPSRMGPGPVAEGVVDRMASGLEAAAGNWAVLAQSTVGPAAAGLHDGMWAWQREDSEEDEGGWWTRRVEKSESQNLAAATDGADADAALATLTAFRADGEPLSVVYEWRVDTIAENSSSFVAATTGGHGNDGPVLLTPRADATLGGEPTDGDVDGAAGGAPAVAVRRAGPVAEATGDNAGLGGMEPSDPSMVRRAQAAGIDPNLVRGLSTKRPDEEGDVNGDPTVVRSVSGTSLHSNYFRDAKHDDNDSAGSPPSLTLPKPDPPAPIAPAPGADAAPGAQRKAGGRRRSVMFSSEEVVQTTVIQANINGGAAPAVDLNLLAPPTMAPGQGDAENGVMSRWLAGLGNWTGLGSNRVAAAAATAAEDEAAAADEEAAVRAARQLNGGAGGQSGNHGGNATSRPKSAFRAGMASVRAGMASLRGGGQPERPVSAGQGRPITALPRSVHTRTQPTASMAAPTGGAQRPVTALRPTTAARPTTSRPLTALLGHDPAKEAKRREKKEREQAIERAADGISRNDSFMILDGADPEEDEDLDEVHVQMMMWNSFAYVWDEIIDDLRQNDLVNDKEVSMLKFVRLDMGSRGHGLRPILLPTFFYAGQVRRVVDTGQVSTAQVMVLNELRVLVVWLGCQVGLLSGKHAHMITSAPFYRGNINVKHALLRKKMLTHGLKLIDQLEQICDRKEVPFEVKDIADHLYQLWAALEGECFAIYKAAERKRATQEELELATIMFEVVTDMKRVISSDPEGLKAVMKASLLNNATADYKELLRVIRVIKRMLTTTEAEATPQSEEAQRILNFFINSLGHPSLDKPPSVDKMLSWSVMTPLYEEDVLYVLDHKQLAKELNCKGKKLLDLLSESDDSFSLMNYLKAMFPCEWSNFKERVKVLNPDCKEMTEHDFAPGGDMFDHRLELQLWASLRGQLLARTCHGMMLNEHALRVLAKLEHPIPPNMNEVDYNRYIENMITPKFEYVVTSQTYGKNRASKDLRLRWLAKALDVHMLKYPRLKIAFIDTAETNKGPTQFSCMARGRDPSDPSQPAWLASMGIQEDENGVIEFYRVRLPQNKYSGRGVVVGEGKPENQNHAAIFAFGEGLQVIDMNQDHYFPECLKNRNLLTELLPSTKGTFHQFADDDEEVQITRKTIASELLYVMHSRQVNCTFTAIVGFREWIFSDKAGALGSFAAATEYAFGTITQRTLTNPGRIRLHYGHPDIFNKMWALTRGGMSKATRQLHIAEDAFSGCNHTIRGGRIRYKEYICCGKGRDMGFDSINGFNYKIAGGGGEWAISREAVRLGTRLDFFRLMMFYHSAIGFYVNCYLTSQSAYWTVYALTVFNLAKSSHSSDLLESTYNVQQVLQLGTLAMIPYIGQLILETGVVNAFLLVFQQIFTGSLLFYMFQQQTIAAGFIADMMYGNAKYVATGRGFNLTSLSFVKIYNLYGRSHMYYAFEMLGMLVAVYMIHGCKVCNYGALTWSAWLLAFALIFSPLWFNPFSFDMAKVSNNYLAWQRWMHGDVDPTSGNNWYTYNSVNLENFRNDKGNNTDQWVNVLNTGVACVPYILLSICAMSRLNVVMPAAVRFSPIFKSQVTVFLMSTVCIWIFVYVTIQIKNYFMELADHKPYRIYRYIMSSFIMLFLIVWMGVVSRWYDGNGLSTLICIMYANFQLLCAFHKFVTVAFSQNNAMRAFVDSFHYTIDQLIGYLLFTCIGFMSFIGVVGALQMKLLFNDAFAQVAGHTRIARAMKENRVGFDVRQSKPGGGGKGAGDAKGGDAKKA